MPTSPTERRSRLDIGARQRLLEEIARIEAEARTTPSAPVMAAAAPTDPEARAAAFRERRLAEIAAAKAAAAPQDTAPAAQPAAARAKDAPPQAAPASAPQVTAPAAAAAPRPGAAATTGQRVTVTARTAPQPVPRAAPAPVPMPPPAQRPSPAALVPVAAPPPAPAPPAVAQRAAPVAPAVPAPAPDVVAPPVTAPDAVAARWAALATVPADERVLERNLIIAAARQDPAHGAFDVLRTRLLQALRDNGWKRVGVTSPTKGCGKSFSALNLAIALSRYEKCRTVLLDMDLRIPALARYLEIAEPGSIGDVLRGLTPASDHLRRFAPNRQHIGANLALGLNARREAYAAELFHEERTAQVLAGIEADYAPDVMLFDLPPALAQDDVIAFRQHLDCILLVVGGGMTTAREVREAIRRIGEDKPIVGIILNKAEGEGLHEYAY